MKTQLYYFSGTGNSLSVAKKLQSELEGSRLQSIPQVHPNQSISGDIIGIICPIYMYNMPHIVAEFIQQIEKANYLFMVYAGGGSLGGGIKKTQKIFRRRHLRLDALFNIPMPSNYAPYGSPSASQQEKLIQAADGRIREIVRVVKHQKQHVDGHHTRFFERTIHPGILYNLGYQRIHMMDQVFTVDPTCNGCGICEQICPVNNITLQEMRPQWHKQCQQCFACLQWCPQEAIQYGKRTAEVSRYHHPEISVKEIIEGSAARPAKTLE